MQLWMVFAAGAVAGLVLGFLAARRWRRSASPTATAVPPAPPPAAPSPAPAVEAKRVVLDEGSANVLNALNNRLAAIGALADLVRGSPLNPLGANALTMLHGEVRRAAEITQHFVNLAEPRLGGVEPADVSTALQSVLAARQAKLKELAVLLSRAIPEQLPAVACPKSELTEMLTRLTGFSLRRLRDSRPPRELRIQATASGPSVSIAFSDSAGALSAEAEQQLASPFRTGESSGTAQIEFAVARAMAQASGGTVQLRPRGGGVTEVVLTLPKSLAVAPAAERAAAAVPRLPKLRILVVEDDEANRQAMRSLLEREGHEVVAVENGREAMAQLEPGSGTFDVVLSDVRMPLLSGRGLYEQLSERQPELARRFVFVTGDQAREETRRFLEECGQPSVLKPYQLGELMSAIAAVTAKK